MSSLIPDGKLLTGAKVASLIGEAITQNIQEGKNILQRSPRLMVITDAKDFGDDSASYLRSIERACSTFGIEVVREEWGDSHNDYLIEERIKEINNDNLIDGVIPLTPMRNNFLLIIKKFLSSNKDVDGIGIEASSKLYLDELGEGVDYFAPCTAKAAIEILDKYGINISGKNMVIIGRSFVVGRPLSNLALRKNATVTIAHSKTENLPRICREADILVACVGVPKLVTKDFVKDNAIIVDVGINYFEGRLVGDVDSSVEELVKYMTPVPKGVGAVTTKILLNNIVNSFLRRAKNE